MGLEIVLFIAAILVGIFFFWRESNSNKAYRVLNKIVNSKELQMSPDNPKGFIYKQSFLPRLVFVVSLCLIVALILEFLTPISVFGSYFGISAFSSVAVGILLGTYLANFVIKSSVIIEEKSDTISDIVGEAVEKGKDFINDLQPEESIKNNKEPEPIEEPKPNKPGKSARERLKDKGLM